MAFAESNGTGRVIAPASSNNPPVQTTDVNAAAAQAVPVTMPTDIPSVITVQSSSPSDFDANPATVKPSPGGVLVIDIGGTKLKILATGQTEPRKISSGKRMTPLRMVKEVAELAKGWEYQAVSIGFPGLVGEHGPRSEPPNLGSGWVGFDYASAFGLPVRMCNDAAMQALGSYHGGRMLFLGFGTGLGSALIVHDTIVSLELGRLLHFDGRELGAILGRRGFRVGGKRLWRDAISTFVPALMAAFSADYVVLGGGNAKEIKFLPPGARLGHNLTAFRGGFRLWRMDEQPLQEPSDAVTAGSGQIEWRLC